MNHPRSLTFWLAERRELIEANIRQHKDIARLTYERDDAIGVVRDLRIDLAAAHKVIDLLMQHAPSDARLLTEEAES